MYGLGATFNLGVPVVPVSVAYPQGSAAFASGAQLAAEGFSPAQIAQMQSMEGLAPGSSVPGEAQLVSAVQASQTQLRSMATTPTTNPPVSSTQATPPPTPTYSGALNLFSGGPALLAATNQPSSVQSGSGTSPVIQTAPSTQDQTTSTNAGGQLQNTSPIAGNVISFGTVVALAVGAVLLLSVFSGGSSK